MSFQKSPGGSIYPYPYKAGELHCVHANAFGTDEEAVISLFRAEGDFFLRQNRRMGVWIDLYDIPLTDGVISALLEFLMHACPRIIKLALVGCSHVDRRRINQRLRKMEALSALPIRYYSDPEEAKTWLVSEGG